VEQVVERPLYHAPGAVGATGTEIGQGPDPGRFDGLGKDLAQARDVLGVDEFGGPFADQLFGAVTEYPPPTDRRAAVAEGAIGMGHHDDVHRVLDEGRKIGLTALERLLQAAAFADLRL